MTDKDKPDLCFLNQRPELCHEQVDHLPLIPILTTHDNRNVIQKYPATVECLVHIADTVNQIIGINRTPMVIGDEAPTPNSICERILEFLRL